MGGAPAGVMGADGLPNLPAGPGWLQGTLLLREPKEHPNFSMTAYLRPPPKKSRLFSPPNAGDVREHQTFR